MRRLARLLPWPHSMRARMAIVVASLVLGAGVGIGSVPLFLFPTRAGATPTDAVVVLAGGRGERIEMGIDLAIRGYGDVLVVSTGTGSRLEQIDCDAGTGPQGIAVLCVKPPLDTTSGEAQMTAALAAEYGWERVTLVTSTYHLTRARWKFERCLEAEVIPVAARPDIPLHTHVHALFHEWVGLAISQTASRDC